MWTGYRLQRGKCCSSAGNYQGYEAIDEKLTSHIPIIADKAFLYTDISFNKAYLTQSFAEDNILANGKLQDDLYHVLQTIQFAGQLEQARHVNVIFHSNGDSESLNWKAIG